MLFSNSPEKYWNLIASGYAASPISDIDQGRTTFIEQKRDTAGEYVMSSLYNSQ